jgi:hypothetical protein
MRAKQSGWPMNHDLRKKAIPFAAFVEVATGLCELNGPWTNRKPSLQPKNSYENFDPPMPDSETGRRSTASKPAPRYGYLTKCK